MTTDLAELLRFQAILHEMFQCETDPTVKAAILLTRATIIAMAGTAVHSDCMELGRMN